MSTRRKPPSGLGPRNADRHELYQTAVQRPVVMVGFIEELFEMVREREPIVLREDFCGTGFLSATWVRSASGREAIGVDNDPAVLAWGEAHHREPLGEDAELLELVCDDVMAVDRRADAVVSLNFSHWVYKERADLLAYLRHAHACIEPGGVFVCDAFGGPLSMQPCLDERPFSEFQYQWEQVSFDPITANIRCAIHFKFRNGGVMKNAFEYDWRMWTIREMTEALVEAGFGELGVYFESEDGFIDDIEEVGYEAWVAYIVALRD